LKLGKETEIIKTVKLSGSLQIKRQE
jgi:hypothetical protein